jgi:hypothetical protein
MLASVRIWQAVKQSVSHVTATTLRSFVRPSTLKPPIYYVSREHKVTVPQNLILLWYQEVNGESRQRHALL